MMIVSYWAKTEVVYKCCQHDKHMKYLVTLEPDIALPREYPLGQSGCVESGSCDVQDTGEDQRRSERNRLAPTL